MLSGCLRCLKARIATGADGASERLVEMEMKAEDLKDIDSFLAKIALTKMRGECGPKMV